MMNIRTQSSPLRLLFIGVVAGLIIGFLIGWLIVGWWIWPVAYTGGAYSYELIDSQKLDYMKMAEESYSRDHQLRLLQGRLWGWSPDDKAEYLARLYILLGQSGRDTEAQGVGKLAHELAGEEKWDLKLIGQALNKILPQYGEEAEKTKSLKAFGAELGLVLVEEKTAIGNTAANKPAEATTPQKPGSQQGGGLQTSKPILLAIPIIAVILGSLAVSLHVKKKSMAKISSDVGGSDGKRDSDTLPLKTWISSYSIGMDSFDEAFSIEGNDGVFLGECGMGVSEIMGEGEPKKVVAFEIWLFDKSEIHTETKIIASEYAYNDHILRTRLASKGELFLARPGLQLRIETSTLKLTALLEEMSYGQDILPDAYFSSIRFALAAYVNSKMGEGDNIEIGEENAI